MKVLSERRRHSPRVAMVVHAYYLRDARVRRYAEALSEAGYEVDVFCLRDRGEQPREVHLGVTILRAPITRQRGSKAAYCLEYVLSLAWLTSYLAVRHLSRHYCIVHVNTSPDVLVVTGLVPRMLGAKLILDFHDPMPELYMSKYRVGEDIGAVRLLKCIEHLSARLADTVLTASVGFRRLFVARQLPAREIQVIRNLPDSKLFARRGPASNRDERCVLLYVGTVSERYGIDVAIRALPQLQTAVPNVELRIFGKISGEGEHQEYLRALSRQLGVADRVHFNGPIPLEMVASEMAKCNIGVYTPHRDVHMDHALSLKVGEFTAVGVPVVTTRTPVMIEEFGEDGACYIEDGDVAGFEKQVTRIQFDPTFRLMMEQKCEVLSAANRWDTEKRRYLQIVSELISENSVRNRWPSARSSVKRVSRRLLAYAGGNNGIQAPNRGAEAYEPAIRILTYHDIQKDPDNDFCVSAKAFEEQMAYLSDHYPVVRLEEVAEWLAGKRNIPSGGVVVTFDDGLEGIAAHAIPVLLQHRLPATVFAVEDFAINSTAPNGSRALSVTELRDLAAAGFSIGSHGRSHVSLGIRDLSPDTITREVCGSKMRLQELLNMPIDFFAYPYGTRRDITDGVVEAVRAAGYRVALTSIHGTNDQLADTLQLRRVKVERFDSLATFRAILRGRMDRWSVVDQYLSFLQRKRELPVAAKVTLS